MMITPVVVATLAPTARPCSFRKTSLLFDTRLAKLVAHLARPPPPPQQQQQQQQRALLSHKKSGGL